MATIYGTNIDFQVPSLDLRFADRKDFIDTISGKNLITFSRNSIGTYVDANGVIQSAASGVARFDHNPVTRESLGLLVEEARTNLLTYSAQFDNAAWSKLNATVTANSVNAPDGTTTAGTFVESTDASSNQHYVLQNYSSVTSGTTYSFSVYAKYATRQWLVLTGNRDGMHANFDLQNGVVGNKGNLVSSQTIQSLPNGWYRCTAVITADSTVGVAFQIYSATSNGTTRTPSYVGTGSNAFYLWGAQLEVGSFPTSYIPTSGSTVTRSADVAQITGSNFSSWYNQSEGTLFVEASAKGSTAGGLIWSFLATLNVTNNHIFADILDQGSSVRLSTYNGSSAPYSVTPSTSGAGYGSLRKAALALKPGNYGAALNGAVQANGTNAAALNAYDRLGIGYYPQFDYGRINSTISRLTYYPTRLSNALLQKLTK